MDLILINFHWFYFKFFLTAMKLARTKPISCSYSLNEVVTFLYTFPYLQWFIQKNPSKPWKTQLAKMANAFLGSILTSRNHGAPFPGGFSEENTVFTLGEIDGLWPFYFFLSRQFLSTDLPIHFHNLCLDHQSDVLEKDIMGVEITFSCWFCQESFLEIF